MIREPGCITREGKADDLVAFQVFYNSSIEDSQEWMTESVAREPGI